MERLVLIMSSSRSRRDAYLTYRKNAESIEKLTEFQKFSYLWPTVAYQTMSHPHILKVPLIASTFHRTHHTCTTGVPNSPSTLQCP